MKDLQNYNLQWYAIFVNPYIYMDTQGCQKDM